MRPTLRQRFDAKYIPEPNSGCWLWLAGCNRDGYGQFWFDGRNRPAHIISYEMFVGKVPAGLTLDHQCDVKCCVNPQHVVPTTMRDNVLRNSGPTAINHRRVVCTAGHDLAAAYITKDGRRQCRICNRRRVDAYQNRKKMQ